MTLNIQKLPSGKTRIEFAHSSSKKPVVVELTPAQVENAIQMLDISQKVEAFEFRLVLPQ